VRPACPLHESSRPGNDEAGIKVRITVGDVRARRHARNDSAPAPSLQEAPLHRLVHRRAWPRRVTRRRLSPQRRPHRASWAAGPALLRLARARCGGLNDRATTSPSSWRIAATASSVGSRSAGTRQPPDSLEPATEERYPACDRRSAVTCACSAFRGFDAQLHRPRRRSKPLCLEPTLPSGDLWRGEGARKAAPAASACA